MVFTDITRVGVGDLILQHVSLEVAHTEDTCSRFMVSLDQGTDLIPILLELSEHSVETSLAVITATILLVVACPCLAPVVTATVPGNDICGADMVQCIRLAHRVEDVLSGEATHAQGYYINLSA